MVKMRNPLPHNLLANCRCVGSLGGRIRPVRRNRSSLARPSLHNCSLRLYRSIATPNVWIPSAKPMKQNTGKESPTAAKDCLRGHYGSFRFRKRPRPDVPVAVALANTARLGHRCSHLPRVIATGPLRRAPSATNVEGANRFIIGSADSSVRLFLSVRSSEKVAARPY